MDMDTTTKKRFFNERRRAIQEARERERERERKREIERERLREGVEWK